MTTTDKTKCRWCGEPIVPDKTNWRRGVHHRHAEGEDDANHYAEPPNPNPMPGPADPPRLKQRGYA